jgi:transposase
MRQKSDSTAGTPEKLVRDIRRATRKQYSAEEKIRIVLDGLRGESSKEFLEAGKRRLAGEPRARLPPTRTIAA